MKITNTFFPQTQLASLICKKHKITIKEKSIAFSCKNKVAFTLLTSMVQYFLLKRQVSTKKTKRPHLIGFSALSKEAGKGINKCLSNLQPRGKFRYYKKLRKYFKNPSMAFARDLINTLIPDSPLLNTKMCVDAGIPSSAGEVLIFSVRYVLPGPVVSVLFGQTKINKE